jgi:endonuclease/exonuclease/phosphatase family metal-dependent hydrolase
MAASWRFATFNIRTARALDGRHPWAARSAAVVDLIERVDADVLGVQEAHAFQLREILVAQPDVEWAGAGRDDGHTAGEHCAVLVRSERGRIFRHRTRWYSDDSEEPGARLPGAAHPRIATIVVIETTDGMVQVANTHLDHQHEANRLRSAELLSAWLDPTLPTVILGDLNVGPDDAVVRRLASAGFRPCRPPQVQGTHHGFSGRVEGRQIDHILVSDHWDILHTEVLHSSAHPVPSDHWPLVATLRLCP